jgi:hypothetical protein
VNPRFSCSAAGGGVQVDVSAGADIVSRKNLGANDR